MGMDASVVGGGLGPQPALVQVDELAGSVVPERTVLLLGAGASVPSGAPTGRELAADLSRELRGRVISDDLVETATILQQRVGRGPLVKAIRARLAPLTPTGGLATIPDFPWAAIYTTNFDQLVERAYRRVGRDVTVIRSNYDWAKLERLKGPPLFKIHGCITEDSVDGHRSGMVLTEYDYDDHENYREALFARLASDLMSKDVLVIGQSLQDRHLQDVMKAAAAAKQRSGAPGRLLALLYESDPDRAGIWTARGFTVAFGGIDDFMRSVTSRLTPDRQTMTWEADRLILKPGLQVAAIDVDHALNLLPDATRMFHGRAATYADIASGLTFPRTLGARLAQDLAQSEVRFLSVVGVAGVGKTTLARQLLAHAANRGSYCWEHPGDYALDPQEWADVDQQLEEKQKDGVLLLDDCAPLMAQVNALVRVLAPRTGGRLKLVLTATNAQWHARMEHPALFSMGVVHRASELSRDDIDALVRLVAERPAIRELVDPNFARLSGSEQTRRLRERARADMYVCLKNIFASEGLDDILLREMADLEVGQQDVYRYVAALEAAGGRVHRQLLLRMLPIRADEIHDLLSGLEGVVDEYTVSEIDGIYRWATRHELIGQTIARYSYSDQDELFDLLKKAIDNLNPAVYLELRSLREMCNSEWGIAALSDEDAQLALYQRMVEVAPGERVPRHRIIRKLLDLRDIEGASQAIRMAEEAVRLDPPLNRYKVRLAMVRADVTPGILPANRLAILRNAEPVARSGIKRFPDDRLAFSVYADLGVAVAERSGDLRILDEALREMAAAYERILDPAMETDLERYERQRRRLAAT
jgi:hypothetical protein